MRGQFVSGRSLMAGVALVSALLFSASAWADGFYADIHGGTSLLNEDSARVTTATSGGSIHAHNNYDPGWLAGASAGYECKNGFATDFEFTFRQNHLDRIASSAPLFLGGDMHTFGMMFNGYYRFYNETRFTPYLGGGVGELVSTLNNTRPAFGVDRGPFGGTQANLAYQGIIGISYPLARRLSIATEYHYLAPMFRPGFKQRVAGVPVKVSSDYDSHNAMLKLVYHFD